MRIIEHGKYVKIPTQITVCNYCQCKFEFDQRDCTQRRIMGQDNVWCVKCPECGSNIKVNTINK